MNTVQMPDMTHARTSRQSPGNFPETAGVFPTQRPPSQPTPVVSATLSSLDHPFEISALALAYAASHASAKFGT
jgi:hypothetical protein